MTPVALDTLRDCMEGVVPAVLATCDADGVPNVSFISQVHYVDPGRIALSYQFFNKTRANLLATGRASVAIFDPVCLGDYRLELDYEETRTEGPLFETMKAKLAGIASHSGMDGVFRLLGADVFRVRAIETIFAPTAARPVGERNLVSATRRASAEMAESRSLGELFDRTLACLERHFGIGHAMVLLLDETRTPALHRRLARLCDRGDRLGDRGRPRRDRGRGAGAGADPHRADGARLRLRRRDPRPGAERRT